MQRVLCSASFLRALIFKFPSHIIMNYQVHLFPRQKVRLGVTLRIFLGSRKKRLYTPAMLAPVHYKSKSFTYLFLYFYFIYISFYLLPPLSGCSPIQFLNPCSNSASRLVHVQTSSASEKPPNHKNLTEQP